MTLCIKLSSKSILANFFPKDLVLSILSKEQEAGRDVF